MDKNRELAELFGIGPTYNPKHMCPHCGQYCTHSSIYCNPPIPVYPDFATDPRLVLREIDKLPSDVRHLFYAKLIYKGDNVEAIDDDGLIPRKYMTDQTGLLRDRLIDFFKRRKV